MPARKDFSPGKQLYVTLSYLLVARYKAAVNSLLRMTGLEPADRRPLNRS